MNSLLPIKTRAAMRYKMSLTDWMLHGWWCLTDRRYRVSVRQLKRAFNLPTNPYIKQATKELNEGTYYDEDNVLDFTTREK